MAVHLPDVSPAERERRLVEASERYMSGTLSAADFEALEKRYMVDYRAAAMEIARSSRRRKPARRSRID
ncbi:MAG: hypothetical protein IT307_01465 [Chloroflexi bacterium]|nr:hypothetical protein [Chloroflexota bacterium]